MNPLTILRIDAAMRGNKTLYWLGRIPLIRRLIADSLYADKDSKMTLSVLLWVWRIFKSLFLTLLYVAVLCILPLLLVLTPDSLANGFGRFCWLLLWLSFVAGSLLNPCAVAANPLKYTCVRMMSMDARRFQCWNELTYLADYFLTFAITLMAATALLGRGPLPGLLLTVELICAHLIAEWLQVLVYDRTKRPLYGRVGFTLIVIFGGLAAAYAPAMARDLQTHNWLLSVPVLLLFLLGGGSAAFLLARYPRWYRLALDTCTPEKVSVELAQKKQRAAAFRDVQLKDSDLTAEDSCAALSGWEYLQALFFRRHSRMMYKPLKYILIAIAAVTVLGGVLLALLRSPSISGAFSNITAVLPYFVFVLYTVQSNIMGNRITKAMFYNCDVSMLKFGWYRHPKVILKNFLLRFRRICGVNLLMSAALCVMFSVMVLCAGGKPPVADYIAFLGSLLALAVFFSVHSLGVYYLFQPFTSDLKAKNPFFGIINGIMYVVCYACIQIRSTPTWFTPLVLAVTILYSALILFFVWLRAPNTFRVK